MHQALVFVKAIHGASSVLLIPEPEATADKSNSTSTIELHQSEILQALLLTLFNQESRQMNDREMMITSSKFPCYVENAVLIG